MAFSLPELPFEKDALEPVISAKTIEFHYGKHHNAYVNNLNKLIEGTAFKNQSLEEIIKTSEGGIFNNAAQVYNHTFYWESLAADKQQIPEDLLHAIVENFGSFDSFKEEFIKTAATHFGSGWAWLVKTSEGKLQITATANAANPLLQGFVPLLTCDVWEHAYYLDYQNRRPDYINAFWNVINWEKVFERFQ